MHTKLKTDNKEIKLKQKIMHFENEGVARLLNAYDGSGTQLTEIWRTIISLKTISKERLVFLIMSIN